MQSTESRPPDSSGDERVPLGRCRPGCWVVFDCRQVRAGHVLAVEREGAIQIVAAWCRTRQLLGGAARKRPSIGSLASCAATAPSLTTPRHRGRSKSSVTTPFSSHSSACERGSEQCARVKRAPSVINWGFQGGPIQPPNGGGKRGHIIWIHLSHPSISLVQVSHVASLRECHGIAMRSTTSPVIDRSPAG